MIGAIRSNRKLWATPGHREKVAETKKLNKEKRMAV